MLKYAKLIVSAFGPAFLAVGLLACGGDPSPTPAPAPVATEQGPSPQTPLPTPSSTPVPKADSRAVFEPADCRFRIALGRKIECGFLTVPEDRNAPSGKTIRLHVATFGSESDDPAPDPIVYLAGGPGEKSLEAVWIVFELAFSPFLKDRDFIMFDQRGAGFSEPSLDCPEILEMKDSTIGDHLSLEQKAMLEMEATFECRDRLVREGVNLAAYTSAENAADLDDLRQALGYSEWNLFGVSYGTKLALTAMRDFPVGIRSVILDSAYPLEVNLFESLPANLRRAFTVLFDGCAADASCNTAYPDLEDVFFGVVEQLNANPVTNKIKNPLTGESFDKLTDGHGLIDFLFQSLYATSIIPRLPKIIYEVRDGKFDTLAQLQGVFKVNDELFSDGMHLSVRCGEEVPFNTEEGFRAAREAYPRLRDYFSAVPIFTICESWGAGPAALIENEPVNSDIPTLVLAGEYDPITPPAWGRLAAESLTNSFYFEFPGVGHGASISGECPLGVALAFLDNPTREPDASCIAEMGGSGLAKSAPQIKLVPFTDEAFGIKGVVPEGWTKAAPGAHAAPSLAEVAIVQQAAPGVPPAQLLSLFAGNFGLEQSPKPVGTRDTDRLSWTLYAFEAVGQPVDLALAEGDGTSYLVMFVGTADDRNLYYDEVFLPAIDALNPISR